ncbi:hypothetical protein K32_24390 [Kaistia sp. 32K]|nr:hypothetical protein K32_24390 [Kaistia sp. 32K]
MRLKLDRPGTEEDRAKLKTAFRRLLKAAGGDESAASITRCGHQRLNKYGLATEQDTYSPIDILLDLERDVGEPVVLAVYADLLGYQLVPKKSVAADAQALGQHLGDIAESVGELMADLGATFAKGVQNLTEKQLDDLDREAERVRNEVGEFEADVETERATRRPGGSA